MWDRYNGARGFHSYITAYIIEISMLQHAGPRSVASSGCSHVQRCKEELCHLSLFQRQGIWVWKGINLEHRKSCLLHFKCLALITAFPILCQMRYIQPFPGQYVSMDPTAVIDVYGIIGTPALWKEHAALVWRVGPTYLLEEALSPEAVAVLYRQGTTYIGNFLAMCNTCESKNVV